ncbi:MBL fold metallo-hydrolase [Paenibacillus thiaminolyticus]|uniref:MBL fold metallo-hydrolase n=1 Tax=Paenibacillus thiaminolyticus TaxID=49283 RepID=UPI0035A58423
MSSINRTQVRLTWLMAGWCTHPEWVTIRNGSLRKAVFPAGFAVIEHPDRGLVLFDTGYASRFFAASAGWPYRLYRMITPVRFEDADGAAAQVKERFGGEAADVGTIIVSHLHADHIGGLKDFPNARFHCFRSAYEAVRGKRGWSALRAGFLPELMPDDFEARSIMITDTGEGSGQIKLPDGLPFAYGCDLFGDGSVVAVDVSGHAHGQMGIFVTTERGTFFLCADAAWSSRAIRERRPPHPAAGFIMSSRSDYRDRFDRLCRLHDARPDIRIVPSHCREADRQVNQEGES